MSTADSAGIAVVATDFLSSLCRMLTGRVCCMRVRTNFIASAPASSQVLEAKRSVTIVGESVPSVGEIIAEA